MTTLSETRPLRADAVRNAERIVRAARELFAENGAHISLNEVARRAGVGAATLYRRFPNKEKLVRAALEQCFADEVDPVVRRALDDDDPWQGMVTVLDAALSMASRELNLVAAGQALPAVTEDISTRFVAPLTQLVRRGQEAGLVRADLLTADVPRIVLMLFSTLWSLRPGDDGWQRYRGLVLDALHPASATPLPRQAAPPPTAEG